MRRQSPETNYSSKEVAIVIQEANRLADHLDLVNLLSAAVISNYLDYLQAYVALVLFMPLVIASGGNTGASLPLMVRALAAGRFKV